VPIFRENRFEVQEVELWGKQQQVFQMHNERGRANEDIPPILTNVQ